MAHRLSHVTTYNDLSLAFDLSKSDRELFNNFLKADKKWDKAFSATIQGTKVTFGDSRMTFDFSQIGSRKVLINGKSYDLGKKPRGYRESLTYLQTSNNAANFWYGIFLPDAEAAMTDAQAAAASLYFA